MKKVLRYVGILLLLVLVLAGAGAAFVAFRGIPDYEPQKLTLTVSATPDRIDRGRQLSAMLCNGCHMSQNTGRLTGREMAEVPQFGKLHSANITADAANGIGKWTDGELIYLLRTGVKPDGRFLPIMAKLHRMSDEDLQSIVAFLRSSHEWVKADNTRQPSSSYSFLTKFLTTIKAIEPMPFTGEAIPQPDTTNQAKWGEYVSLYRVECYACHSADFKTDDFIHPEKSKGFFGGGNKFDLPGGKAIYSRNLTMDEETGIGRWTEDEFVRALKTGVVPNGQPALREPMMPFMGLSDGEAKAIYAYLKTLPKISNKVERTF